MRDGEALAYNDEIDLRKYVRIFQRHRQLIVGVTAMAAVLGLVMSLSGPRQFVATAIVMVPLMTAADQPSAPSQVVGGVQGTIPTVVYSQQTYARLLTSTVLRERVAKKLNLHELAGSITVKPIRDTRLMEVTVRGRNGQQVADIANALAESLVEYDRQVITAELTQSRQFVQGQLAKARSDLQTGEQALRDFSERENLPALEAELSRQLTQLTALRQAYEQNQTDLSVTRGRLAAVRQELASTNPMRFTVDSTQANSTATSVAAQLRAKLADLTTQRAALLQRYTPTNPLVVAVDAQIQQTQRALTDASTREPRSEEARANSVREQLDSQEATLRVDVAGFEAKDRVLSRAIPQKEHDLTVLNTRLADQRAQLNRLTRTVDTAKGAFTSLSGKATEAVVAEGMQNGFVRVVDRAVARSVPRGTVRATALATIFGLITGVALAFIVDAFHSVLPLTLPISPVASERRPDPAPTEDPIRTAR